jgi:hypothetical protein
MRNIREMREIGRIKGLQVQPTSLKVGQKPYKYYDPSPLLIVDHLLVSTKGAIGIMADGSQVIDVHHMDHPESHNIDGINGLSIGFTSHYEAMRSKFGQHIADGCAGENILVEAEREYMLGELRRGMAIQSPDTGQVVHLTDIVVAAPCVEFSHYAANSGEPLPNRELRTTLQFLDEGMRGFYASATNSEDQIVALRVGDRVFVAG